MSQFAFSYRITASDDTQPTLRSAMGNLTRFARAATKPITIPIQIARGGLGLLRDINLGLAPLVRGIDQIIERGAGLEVVRKSFASLTRGGDTRKMANELVNASHGMLGFSRAMQIANRALASGLTFQQLPAILDFVSKKAVSTGKDAGQALDTVITGLSRGSTLFLDDFGILVDGVEGVKSAFDRLKGAGSFDKLLPSEQKAETVRQALVEMGAQAGKLNISGNETVFVYQRIKNQIGDTVDKLAEAVAKSGALNEFMRATSDSVRAITRNFETGGGFGGLLFGNKQGMPGLLDFAEALMQDLGEALGIGFIGQVRKGLAGLRIPGFGGAGGPGGAGATSRPSRDRSGDIPATIFDPQGQVTRSTHGVTSVGGAARAAGAVVGGLEVEGSSPEFSGFRRTRELAARFLAFGREDEAPTSGPSAASRRLPLTQTAERRLRAQLASARQIERVIRAGGRGVRQQALRDTAEEVKRLRGEGFDVRASDRRAIFNRLFGEGVAAGLEGSDEAPGPARRLREAKQRLKGSQGARTERNEAIREERERRRAELLGRRQRREELREVFGPAGRSDFIPGVRPGTLKLGDFPEDVVRGRREELKRIWRDFDSAPSGQRIEESRRSMEEAAKAQKTSAEQVSANIEMMRRDMATLTAAAKEVAAELAGFPAQLEAAGRHRV